EISFLFTTRAGGYMIGSFFGGWLYDRLRGHPVMAGGLLLMGLGMFLTPLLPSLWPLAAVLLVVGLAEGAVDVGGNTLLPWIHRSKVGPYMNALHFTFGVGAFLAPLVIAFAVQQTGGIRWGYWLLALYVVPVLLWLAREPSPLTEVQQDQGRSTGVNWRLVSLMAFFMFLYAGAEIGFGGWVYTYAFSTGLVDSTVAFYVTSTFWGALTLGRLAAIWIAARVRPRTILISDLMGGLLSLALLLALPDSQWALWVGVFGLGLSLASIFPTLITWSERRTTVSGLVTSFFLIGSSVGAMTLPWLIGQLFEVYGPQVTLFAILLDLLAASGVFVALMAYGGPPKPELIVHEV
ncbi:MAG TPA: MFS transporter, partial [Caldilineaceae bacterium]|nr:MFS transporter [Caldilineaceae bacterium]